MLVSVRAGWTFAASVLALVYAGCGDPAVTPDAGSRCPTPPAVPLCSATCGNNVIDECTTPHPFGEACTTYTTDPEPCDGTGSASICTELGYFGGVGSCSRCELTDRGCDACAPGVVCTTHALPIPVTLQASGSHLGVVTKPVSFDDTKSFTVFDATFTQVARLPLDELPMVTNVPDGWLLVEPTFSKIHHVTTSGVVTTQQNVFAYVGPATAFTSGPGNRALLLLEEAVVHHVRAALFESDGTLVGAPFVLFDAASDPLAATSAVTSDGTSFFVAVKGRLARVSSDGTIASVESGFPVAGSAIVPTTVTWSGTTGWYIVPTDTTLRSYIAQRFDANAAKVGTPLMLLTTPAIKQWIAHGAGLVGMTQTPPSPKSYPVSNALRVFDSTAALIASHDVGLGLDGAIAIAPLGAAIAVGWYGALDLQLAVVTP
jgi:hypothetical protein